MADITPVTREEFYLAKAGGQDVPVPSAVTREEYYLEKLSNDSVVVPSPVTRREKFLYFACGGEIDLPSEEKMTRLERLIAKAGGMDVSTPTAVTRLEKFWANVEGGGWKTLTGTLPMTFSSNGAALIDYRIYGTADGAGVQTENEFDYATAQMLNCYINTNNTIVYSANDRGVIVPVQPSTTYTLVMTRYAKEGTLEDDVAAIATTTLPERGTQGRRVFYAVRGDVSQTFTTDADEYFVYFKFCNTTRSYLDEQLQTIMLVKDSIPPETYIPHGYKLLLQITSGTESKTADIYIGDSRLGEAEYVDYGEQKIYKRILFMTHNDKQFITKDNKDFCLRRRGYNG